MMNSYQGWSWPSVFAGALATGGAITLTGCLAIAFSEGRALAQVLPDASLGTKVDGNLRITGGTTTVGGKNLFHSFTSFSVPSGQTALFDNASSIVNIFGRVTGPAVSNIQGTIKAQGNANLFLMNPNGIIFGPNSRLDIGGSFVGTTANAIGFPGGGVFSQTSPVAPVNPVLAVNPNALFFNQTPAGAIVNQSTAGLNVGSNASPQNLFLVGGNVIFQGGKLTAPGGQVVLGGLAEEGVVEIRDFTSDGSNPTLKFPDVTLHFPDDVDQANVSLTNSTIDASKTGRRAGFAGDIFIFGDRIAVDQSNILSNGKFGRIYLNARDQVSIVNNSQIKTRGFDNSSDIAGLIKIAATEGSVLVDQSTLSTTNPGSGLAGDISISAREQVSIVNDSGIFSQGDFGNIFIGESDNYSSFSPRTVTIDNSTLQTNGLGSGIAGNIFIRAHDRIAVENSSEIASRSENDRTDDFGAIKLAATEGSVLLNQSTLSTTNSSTGFAGDISISARDEVAILNQSNVLSNGYFGRILIGRSDVYDSSFSPITVRIDDSTVRAESTVGIAGNISIDAIDSIAISNIPLAQDDRSRFSTNARGDGVIAGDISLQAGNSVSIANSIITSELDPGITGKAGTIDITASSIALTNNTELRTLINGTGIAGDITLQTNGGSVSMDNSRIFSTVESGGNGSGGNIEIYTNSLTMSNIAQLQTLIRGGGVGEAGVIFVDTNGGSVSLTGSDPVTGFSTGMFSTIQPGAEGRTRSFAGGVVDAVFGNGGDINSAIFIFTGTLSLTDGAVLNTSTLGRGNAGAVYVEADDDVSIKGAGIGSVVGQQATGNAGAILMSVGSLSIASTSDYNAGLTTETFGQGDAGLVYVVADKDISIRGGESGTESGIASRVSEGSTYNSGGIILNARSLFLRDEEAKVTVNNQGSGFAGGIYINMREDIILRDQGEISATASSGSGAEIYLTSGDFLVLVSGSKVTAQAGQNTNPGDGGNVFIDTRYVIAAPFKDNNIDANAFLGSGGNIRVDASRLYDIDKREGPSPQSNDITASSDYGPPGQVGTSPLNPDPTQGLANLPANPVDPTTLIAETCAPRGGIAQRQQNRFIVTGRGGLPPDPNAAFPGEAGVNDLGSPEGGATNSTDDPSSTNPSSPAPAATPPSEKPEVDKSNSANPTSSAPAATVSPQKPEPVEAQGWVYGKNGDIVFTAQAPTITPNQPVLTPTSTCNAVSKSPQ